MFTTVQQGIEKYRVALSEYRLHLDSLEEKFPRQFGKPDFADFLISYGGPYFDRTFRMTERLRAMAEALGLTPAEIKALDAEFEIPLAA
jgi:hypothetical protein